MTCGETINKESKERKKKKMNCMVKTRNVMKGEEERETLYRPD